MQIAYLIFLYLLSIAYYRGRCSRPLKFYLWKGKTDMKKHGGDKKQLWLKAGFVVGVLAILIGIYFMGTYKDTVFYGSPDSFSGGTLHLGTAKFGADFYTEIYESTTFAGNAVKGVYELLGAAFGMLFILIGAIDVCVFGVKLAEYKPAPQAQPAAPKQPVQQVQPVQQDLPDQAQL